MRVDTRFANSSNILDLRYDVDHEQLTPRQVIFRLSHEAEVRPTP